MNWWLPGVFETNPVSIMNLPLWTVPFELECYAIMSGFIIFGLLKRPVLILFGLAAYMVAGVAIKLSGVQAIWNGT
jgi:peptidoglycan/LPS O-acetylase OafA/YrhL